MNDLAMPRPATAASDRSIGAILIDTGVITPDGAERALRLQKSTGIRFGEAAEKLGLVTDADIRYALAAQFDYPYLQAGKASVTAEVLAAYQPFVPQVEALRQLRSQLMLRWFTGQPGRDALAIVSPSRSEGRSWLVANLAVVFSQLGERTLVIDADLRQPRQHALFGLDNGSGLSTALTGKDATPAVQRVAGLRDLSVLTAGPTPPNPQELLGRGAFSQLIAGLGGDYDVILMDTPAAETCADAQMIAARCGGALLVTRQDHTLVKASRHLVESIHASGAKVVGAALSDI